MKSKKHNTRRSFIKKSIAASSIFVVPRHVIGGKGFTPPSDKLNLAAIGAGIKTFINSNIRKGQLPTARKNPVKDYIEYVDKYYEDKVISKLKTDKSIDSKRAAKKQLRSDLGKNAAILKAAFEYVDLITQAKVQIIKKLVSLDKQKQFVKTSKGFKVTNPEGFVAINSKKGEAVKFVDRLEFSYNNFSDSVIKGWQK